MKSVSENLARAIAIKSELEASVRDRSAEMERLAKTASDAKRLQIALAEATEKLKAKEKNIYSANPEPGASANTRPSRRTA